MQASLIHEIFTLLARDNANPTTELIYYNNYTLLVAVVLSAQATDISVNKATKELFNIVKMPKDMLELGEEKLKEHIKSIGLYNSKAKNVIALSKILVEKYNQQIPNTLEELQELPGVGRKTANVVLNVVFDVPTIAVDTHVFRVSKRIGLTDAESILQVEKDLLRVVPKEFLKVAHNLLILHGRYTCIAKKPKCTSCILQKLCLFTNKNI
ncbi:endonuclease III [Rickettsiales bacterium LUAb2]